MSEKSLFQVVTEINNARYESDWEASRYRLFYDTYKRFGHLGIKRVAKELRCSVKHVKDVLGDVEGL